MEEFIKLMPKIELHAHLNGSLSTDVLLELGKLKYGKTSQDFANLCKSFTALNTDLATCFGKFKIAHDLTNTMETLKKAAECAIRDFALDNVIYLELRTTPKNTDAMSKTAYLKCVLEVIRDAQIKWPDMIVKLLPSIDRSQPVESAKSTIETVFALLPEYSDIIKGIDLSGNPVFGTFDMFKDLLEDVRNRGLKLTLHCGEVDNPNEIAEMLEFGMSRCGHGTFIKGDNLQTLIKKKIPLECCLTSNVKCGTVRSYIDHHFRDLLAENHPVLLCTDDFGVFDTTLSKEYMIAIDVFELKYENVHKLLHNGVDCSFAEEREKNKMRQKIDEYFQGKI